MTKVCTPESTIYEVIPKSKAFRAIKQDLSVTFSVFPNYLHFLHKESSPSVTVHYTYCKCAPRTLFTQKNNQKNVSCFRTEERIFFHYHLIMTFFFSEINCSDSSILKGSGFDSFRLHKVTILTFSSHVLLPRELWHSFFLSKPLKSIISTHPTRISAQYTSLNTQTLPFKIVAWLVCPL